MLNYLLNPWVSVTIMILVIIYVQGKKYFSGTPCIIEKNMTGQVVIVTGANRGIGRETAKAIAKMKAHVIFACRNKEKTEAVIQQIKLETQNGNLEFIQLDLADINSVKRFAAVFKSRFQRLDVLINNAATYKADYFKTREQNEVNFCVNLLSPFILTILLLDLIRSTPFSRIINLSSGIHHNIGPENFQIDELNEIQTFNGSWINGQYAKTKLGIVFFTKELQRRIQSTQTRVLCVNPGYTDTELFADFMNGSIFGLFYKCLFPLFSFFLKDEEQGAQTVIFCTVQSFDRLVPGGYYQDCQIAEISPYAEDLKTSRNLWDFMVNTVELT